MIDASYARHLTSQSIEAKISNMLKDYLSSMIINAAKIGQKECCLCLAAVPCSWTEYSFSDVVIWLECNGYTVTTVNNCNSGSQIQTIGYMTIRW